jgi:hypothetical protein
MSCVAHSPDLTLSDMANSCKTVVSFFGVMQRIYCLFARSTKRWKILFDNVERFTVKPLSDTRWESRVKSVQPIRYQTPQIISALNVTSAFLAPNKSPNKSCEFSKLSRRAQLPPFKP